MLIKCMFSIRKWNRLQCVNSNGSIREAPICNPLKIKSVYH